MAEHDTSRLRELADALDIPPEAFWAAIPDGDPDAVIALLRLWSAIPDPQARNRVLGCLRAEVERAGFRT